MSKADEFLLSMKDEADALIRDDTLKKVLSWAKEKATSIGADCKPSILRINYLYLAHAIPLDLDIFGLRALSTALGRDLPLDLDFDLALDLNLSLALNINSDFVPDNAVPLVKSLKLARQMKLDSLVRALEKLKALPPKFSSQGDVWAESLRQVMVRERNIGHKFDLNKRQKACLKNYLYANHLIVDCLNNKTHLSKSVREEILDTLLIPPDLQGVTHKSLQSAIKSSKE